MERLSKGTVAERLVLTVLLYRYQVVCEGEAVQGNSCREVGTLVSCCISYINFKLKEQVFLIRLITSYGINRCSLGELYCRYIK